MTEIADGAFEVQLEDDMPPEGRRSPRRWSSGTGDGAPELGTLTFIPGDIAPAETDPVDTDDTADTTQPADDNTSAENERADEVAAVPDALAYDRYKNIIPVYYDSYMTYKGVRDEDSLEMLEIMTAGRTMDVGMVYGWCYELIIEGISRKVPSDTIASQRDAVNEYIDGFVNEYFS